MRNGFSFKGVHSSAFLGVTVRTKDRPIMPEPKIVTYSSDNMNGEIDFTDYTGITYYNPRTFQAELSAVGADLTDLQSKLSSLARWLNGKGELIFDDIPNVIWTARVSSAIPYMPERGKTAVLMVSFLCEPFSSAPYDAFDGPLLDYGISLRTDIQIGSDAYYTLPAGTEVEVTINIQGDVYAEPIFMRTTAGTDDWDITVSNSLGVRKVYTTRSYRNVAVINCKNKTVCDADGNSQISYIALENNQKAGGSFPVLMPNEDNIVKITSPTDTTIHYTPKYFYGGVGND